MAMARYREIRQANYLSPPHPRWPTRSGVVAATRLPTEDDDDDDDDGAALGFMSARTSHLTRDTPGRPSTTSAACHRS